jgi:hypothetical protein
MTERLRTLLLPLLPSVRRGPSVQFSCEYKRKVRASLYNLIYKDPVYPVPKVPYVSDGAGLGLLLRGRVDEIPDDAEREVLDTICPLGMAISDRLNLTLRQTNRSSSSID